jgi:hypothetical protein
MSGSINRGEKMTKHHHQSRAEQIDNKAHGAPPFHFKKKPGDTSTQTRANQVDDEKGSEVFMEKEVVLETFTDRYEAEMAKGLLDEQGILNMISDDDTGGLHPGMIVRACSLIVNEEDFQRAKEVIKISEINVGDTS